MRKRWSWPGTATGGIRTRSPGESDLFLHLRKGLPARLYHIMNLLRIQFAPATMLFWNYILKLKDKPQVIHCNDLDTLLVGVLAKQYFGCRVVYDAHEFFPVSDPYGRWIDIKLFSLIERALIRQADAAVTVNPMLAELMASAYGVKVHSVPNAEPWVARRRFGNDQSIADLAGHRVKFLFQGRFSPDRGIDEVIQAWAKVDSGKAALFLRGPDNRWRQAAINLARRLGLLGRSVYFLDAVTEDELVSAAAAAQVGIIPYKPAIINDRFACPNKLSQYLHAGLMILTNDLPYVKSVVMAAQAGLVYASEDPATLVNAVHRIVDDPAAMRRFQQNAWRYARETFNWQAQAGVSSRSIRRQGPPGIRPGQSLAGPTMRECRTFKRRISEARTKAGATYHVWDCGNCSRQGSCSPRAGPPAGGFNRSSLPIVDRTERGPGRRCSTMSAFVTGACPSSTCPIRPASP